MPFGGVLFISASGGLCSVAGLRREAGIRPPSPRGRAGPSAEPARAPLRLGNVSGSYVARARLPLLRRAANSAGEVRPRRGTEPHGAETSGVCS